MTFSEWLAKIDSHIQTGESFARTNVCMFDAMPGFWKRLTVKIRQQIIQRVRTLKKETEGGLNVVWTNKDNILSFVKYVPLQHVPSLPVCYQVALDHPSVIVGDRQWSQAPPSVDTDQINTDTRNVTNNKKDTPPPPLQSFMMLPPNLVSAANKADDVNKQKKTERRCLSTSSDLETVKISKTKK